MKRQLKIEKNKSQPPRYECNWASIKALVKISEIYAINRLQVAILSLLFIGFIACKEKPIEPPPKEQPIIGKKWELIAVAKTYYSMLPIPDSLWKNAQAKDYFELLPDSSYRGMFIVINKKIGTPDPDLNEKLTGYYSGGVWWYELTNRFC